MIRKPSNWRYFCSIILQAIFTIAFANAHQLHANVLNLSGIINGNSTSFSLDAFDISPNEAKIHEFLISDLSPFAALTTQTVPGAQLLLSYGKLFQCGELVCRGGLFLYSEIIDAYNASTLEYVSHSLEIRLAAAADLSSLIGVADAFPYSETKYYAQNYTFDGSTIPVVNRIDVTGTLTLTSITPSDDPPETRLTSFVPGAGTIPEPETLTLLAFGFVGLRFVRRKR